MRRLVSRIHDTWREQFARAARRDREKARLLHEQQVREAQELRQDVNGDTEFVDIVLGMALASPADVAAFRVHLDRYDEATVAALMTNEEQLAEVRRTLDEMFGRAHVLPDGRRVFKTRDGLLVFDEHGSQLGLEVIDPAEIAETRPVWEDVTAAREIEDRLIRERTELLRFQERIDATRERLDDNDLTQRELEELKADLEQSAPNAVRREMPGYVEHPNPVLSGQLESASLPSEHLTTPIRSFDQFAPQ